MNRALPCSRPTAAAAALVLLAAGTALAQPCGVPEIVHTCFDGGSWTLVNCWNPPTVPTPDLNAGITNTESVVLGAIGSCEDLTVFIADVHIAETGNLNVFGDCVSLDLARILLSANAPGDTSSAILNFQAPFTTIGGQFENGGGSILLEARDESSLGSASVFGETVQLAPEIALAGTGIVSASIINDTGSTTAPPIPPFSPGIYADQPGRTLRLIGPANVNNAVIEARNGGILELESDWTQDPAAVTLARDGSTVLLDGASITGGTLQSLGTGLIEAGQATLTGLQVAPGSHVLQPDNSDVVITDGLTNHGVWTLAGPPHTSRSDLTFSGDQTLDGTGEIVLEDQDDAHISMSPFGSTLTHASGHTIRGTGQLLSNSGYMTNHGSILADGATALVIDPRDGTPGFVNLGLLKATGTGGLHLEGGLFFNDGATIGVAAGSRLEVHTFAEIIGGTIDAGGGGSVLVENASIFRGVTVAPGSHVDLHEGADATISDGLTNHGVWTLDDAPDLDPTVLRFVGDQTLSGTGEIVMSDQPGNRIIMFLFAPTLTNAPGHTIRGAGTLLRNTGDMVNNGTILAEGTSPLIIDPGSSSPGFVSNGTLGGTGTLEFPDGTLDNRGRIAPGTSIGSLGVTATDVLNAPSALLEIELAGDTPGSFDTLNVTGSFHAGGEIAVFLTGGFEPDGTESMVILSAGAVTGFFANADPGADNRAEGVSAGDATFDVVYGPGSITIENITQSPCSPADLNHDGLLDLSDITAFVTSFSAMDPTADINGDGLFDLFDINQFIFAFIAGCP